MTGVGIELSQTKVWTAKKPFLSTAFADVLIIIVLTYLTNSKRFPI